MAFSDFKSVSQVQEKYKIKYIEDNFIEYREYSVSESFLKESEFNREHIDIFISEASRCENIIYPILREVYKNFVEKYSLWSHKSISYNEELTGTPNYIISTRSDLGKTVIGLPLVLITEAKQNNFIEGWGQCLAELIAAQKINKNDAFPVYGIVTDGELWQFGRLVSNIFTKHKTGLTIDNIDKIFGAINYLLSLYGVILHE